MNKIQLAEQNKQKRST